MSGDQGWGLRAAAAAGGKGLDYSIKQQRPAHSHQRLLLPLVVLVEGVQRRGDAKVGEQLARVPRVLSQHQRRAAQHLLGIPDKSRLRSSDARIM